MERGIFARLLALVAVASAAACGTLPDYGAPRARAEDPSPEDSAHSAPAAVIVVGATGPRYPIRLTWPAVAGQSGTIEATSVEEKTMRVNRSDGRIGLETMHRRVALRGVYEIVSVNREGGVDHRTIEHATLLADAGEGAIPDEAPPALVHGGTISITGHDDGARVDVDGSPASEDVRSAIDEVLPIGLTNSTPDDDVVGSAEPQPIGASWPVESGLARASLTGPTMRVKEGAIAGQMRLDSVGAHDGVDCIEVTGNMDIEPFDLASLPRGAHLEKGRVHVITHLVVPTSPMPRLDDEMTMTTDVTVTIPGSGAVDLTSKKETRMRFTPTRAVQHEE